VRVLQREWVKGEDHTAELAHVRRLRDSLENEKRTSTDWDDEYEKRYQASMQHYRRRIKTLRAGYRSELPRLTSRENWSRLYNLD
jgi:hypothetical protein